MTTAEREAMHLDELLELAQALGDERTPLGVRAAFVKRRLAEICKRSLEAAPLQDAAPAARQPLTLPQLAQLLVQVGADPDEPGEWHLEFARAIEAAHGIGAPAAPDTGKDAPRGCATEAECQWQPWCRIMNACKLVVGAKPPKGDA